MANLEIVIKEDGNFLDLTGVPDQLKLRSGLRKYLYRRDCYDDFIKDILASLPRKHCRTIAILGTAGIGKSSLFLVLLKMLFEDPSQFGLATRSFYFQTLPSDLAEHAGISLIFTSFRPSRFKEITKNGWNKVMPTWSADEQAEYFNSTQFESEYSKEVAKR
eukprot:gene34679-41995_t